MANEVRIRASVDDKVSGPLTKIRDKFDLLGKSGGFKTLTQGVGLGIGSAAFNSLGAAASVAAGFIEDSIKSASNMNEQANKAKSIFGASSDEVVKFGDSTARAFGISKREALEAAGNFGNLFNTIGLTTAESSKMSTELVGLAADLASFNNIATSDALEKLRSGLAGEAEPLRQVGVLLNESQVAAEATALGFKKVNGQFSEGQKVQARYSLILKQTTAAQGDFARTSGSMANQQRILAAKMEDTEAAIGKKLLPVVVDVQRKFIGLFDEIEKGRGPVVAVASAFDDMGRQLDYLSGANRNAGVETDFLGSKTTALGQALHDIFDAGWRDRIGHASADIDHTGSALNVAGARASDFGDKAKAASEAAQQAMDDMVTKLKSNVESLVKDVYDPIEQRDRLAANRVEADALNRIIHSKKSTDAEIADARRKLRSLEADNVDYLVALVESGDATQTEYKRLMTILERKSKTATGKAKDDVDALIAKIKELHRVTISGPSVDITIRAFRPKDKGYAKGGFVPAGESVTVGEEGIEKLTVFPGGGAYVTPNHKLFKPGVMKLSGGGGGVGGQAIHLHFHGMAVPPTQAQAAEIGRAIGPAVATHLRDRGLISRG